ncbi:MAG: hypothetical protein EZS28_027091 [Streblomastix strix]|uniref:SPRY domain-containing protein n=1 Tax=Streblomastix strix TaxID=222440 RepID=A0A5J4V4C1_9EUKA|nr:MAG: hypothetical protein EZS28_027091 [Streblomastix strix]
MNINSGKDSDLSLRSNDNVRTDSVTAAAQIRQLRMENEALRREKSEIASQYREQVIILESRLRDEKEQREAAEKHVEEEKEQSKKERNEKIELKIQLQDGQEMEKTLFEKEKEKRKIEQKLKYNIEEKEDAIRRAEKAEKQNKEEIERRRKVEDENIRLKWTNDELKNDVERLSKELEIEINLVAEFETKYNSEIQENEIERKIIQEKETQRQQIEIMYRKEQKEKEIALKHSNETKKAQTELNENYQTAQMEIKKNKEDIDKLKENVNQQEFKLKEEQEKRKEAETQQRKIEEENWQLKREAEKVKCQIIRMKQKFGDEKIDEELQRIEDKEKENENKIRQLKEEKERKDDELLKKDEENKMLKNENMKLQLDIENLKPKLPQEPQDFPIAIINPDPSDFEFKDIDGKMKKIIKKKTTNSTFSLEQVIENGIWNVEVEFNGSQSQGEAFGIVKDSCKIPTGVDTRDSPQNKQMATFMGCGYDQGVICKGNRIAGNKQFQDNQIIKAEYDSNQGTLICFVDGVQQPVYISGIKEKIRFIIHMYQDNSSCTIRSLKKLAAPTTGHVENEKVVQW